MKELRPAAVLLALFTVLCGILYPLATTGAANLIFPHEAHGSMMSSHGHTVGSELIGQSFTAPGHFWGRPSAVSYDAKTSSGTNQGPTNPALTDAVTQRVQALRDADPDNTAPVPADLVTASGSGLDPDITPAAAYYQISRIVKSRPVTAEQLKTLIDHHITERQLGFLGERRVNVLELNLALDELAGSIAVESGGQ